MIGSDLPDLTPGAHHFLATWGKRLVRPVAVIPSYVPDHVRDAIVSHEQEFGGIAFPVLGGELEGWLECGVKSRKPWRSGAGEWVFHFADPQFVQCALVCRADGCFGVSWSEEFLPWHADARGLIEASALWADLIGWRKSTLRDGDPNEVLNALDGVGSLVKAEYASSRETSWWLGDGVALYVEPYLTHLPEGATRVHVMTSDPEAHQRVMRALEAVRKPGVDLMAWPVEGCVLAPEECPFG
ncbi:hypothetical protein [Actinosynnema sp. NPDC023587]|uniref:hypothetical protein n=1 Tax=Actinosynnema sp. NPDC023587 TaxID=3154695 RepID=UPI0033DBB990